MEWIMSVAAERFGPLAPLVGMALAGVVFLMLAACFGWKGEGDGSGGDGWGDSSDSSGD